MYNDKLDQLNQMAEDGLYSEGPTEQIIWYSLDVIDSSTYVELVHDMTTVSLPTQTWNEETQKFDLDYIDSRLFEYLYDKEDYNVEKNMQNEGIGITLNNDIIFMSWYRC